jgi:hypothetical protein
MANDILNFELLHVIRFQSSNEFLVISYKTWVTMRILLEVSLARFRSSSSTLTLIMISAAATSSSSKHGYPHSFPNNVSSSSCLLRSFQSNGRF